MGKQPLCKTLQSLLLTVLSVTFNSRLPNCPVLGFLCGVGLGCWFVGVFFVFLFNQLHGGKAYYLDSLQLPQRCEC